MPAADFPKRPSRWRAFLRKRWKGLTALALIVLAPPLAADRYVAGVADGRVFRDLAEVPPRRVALVLGTSKWAPGGSVNLFYERRVQAALELYRAGKVTRILVSGDNSAAGYDEPTDLRDDLVALGVPADHVVRDSAGFRTLDSVVRAHEVFQLDGFVVVSQEFHCARAVYLARQAGLDAVGYAARDVGGPIGWKIRLREVAARMKAVVDVVVLDRQPKSLGEPEPIA